VTLAQQCWLFAIGSSLFAVATVPGFSAAAGAAAANALCFVGSWFFTSAAWIQLVRSGPEGSVEWYSAAVQFGGTVLFNVSTGASVWAHAIMSERRLVWAPDATGSIAFLASAALGIVAITASFGAWAPAVRDWQAGWVNRRVRLPLGRHRRRGVGQPRHVPWRPVLPRRCAAGGPAIREGWFGAVTRGCAPKCAICRGRARWRLPNVDLGH
jgi:hypothetical protein